MSDRAYCVDQKRFASIYTHFIVVWQIVFIKDRCIAIEIRLKVLQTYPFSLKIMLLFPSEGLTWALKVLYMDEGVVRGHCLVLLPGEGEEGRDSLLSEVLREFCLSFQSQLFHLCL